MLLQVPPQDNTQGGGKVSVKKPSEQRSLPSAPIINQCGLPPILQELCGGEGGGAGWGVESPWTFKSLERFPLPHPPIRN